MNFFNFYVCGVRVKIRETQKLTSNASSVRLKKFIFNFFIEKKTPEFEIIDRFIVISFSRFWNFVAQTCT